MPLTLGLIGGGVVGGGVVEMLRDNSDVKFAKLCVRDKNKPRDFELPAGCQIVTDVNEVLNDPSIGVVVEVMGGTGLAKEVTMKALQSGKSVVSANKALISACLREIDAVAKPSSPTGGHFLYEAAVCGGIPIINVFLRALQGDQIKSFAGIMNGTTNFILSKMEKEGAPYDKVLKEAQDLGYAEADPAADVEGWDARSKLCILSRLAFGIFVDESKVPCTGISRVTDVDFTYAKMAGKTIRITGNAAINEAGQVSVWVSPVLVPLTNGLASVNGPTNAVQVNTACLGTSLYTGAGAGRFPTANSVVSDILELAAGRPSIHPFGGPLKEAPITDDFESEWYIRFVVDDQVGVMHTLTGRMAEAKISVFSVLQAPIENKSRVPFAILTEKCWRSQTLRLMELLQGIQFLLEKPLMLPVLAE